MRIMGGGGKRTLKKGKGNNASKNLMKKQKDKREKERSPLHTRFIVVHLNSWKVIRIFTTLTFIFCIRL